MAFIPARGGSKSIPLKNIKDFGGQPLIYWNLLALQATTAVDHIVVATDSKPIADTVQGFSFDKVTIFHRSELNAQDQSSTESVMLEYLTASDWEDKTRFILAQATSPLTQKHHFEEALAAYQNSAYDSLLSVCRTKRFFWNAKGEPLNYDYQSRPRRQDFDGYLMENGAFYISTVGNIRTYKNRLSGYIGLYEMPEYTALEIDEPHDWIIGEQLLKKYGL